MTSEPMKSVLGKTAGCIFLMQYPSYYRIRAIQDIDGKAPLVKQTLRSWTPGYGKLLHVIYTDSLPYVMERLNKHFYWKRIKDDRFALHSEDVKFFQSIRSEAPLRILQQMMPGLSLKECQAVYADFQTKPTLAMNGQPS